MKKYILRFEDTVEYEVKAESAEEALAFPIPKENHKASITIIGECREITEEVK